MKHARISAAGALALAAMIASLVLPAGCGKSSQSNQPYRIGAIFSITGPSSFLGDPEKKSLDMAVEEMNSRGGIDGHKLEAVIYDDEGDPTKAVLLANKLISRDEVIAIIGPSLTPTTLPIIPVVEKAGVPLLSCAAGIKITEPVKPLVFKTAQNDVLAVRSIYRNMQSKNIKKIAILTVENAYGESGKEQLAAQAPNFGIEVALAETFGAKDTDMTAQLAKIRAAQPEAIVCWGTNPGPGCRYEEPRPDGHEDPPLSKPRGSFAQVYRTGRVLSRGRASSDRENSGGRPTAGQRSTKIRFEKLYR